MDLRQQITEENADALFADGFDDALVGSCYRFAGPPVAAYDYDRMIEILVERDGTDWEEAEESLDFNVLGAWNGENGPVYIRLGTREVGGRPCGLRL